MGKLTDSLKATNQKLDKVKHGIAQMQELGQALAENTVHVADKALRAGYAFAQAEAAEATSNRPEKALPAVPSVLDADQLQGATRWSEKLLKQRFTSFNAAYRYLKDTYHIQLSQRNWKTVVDAFNGSNSEKVEKESDRTLADRVANLEKIVLQQGQYIAALEAQLNDLITHLSQ